ncbi:MAG TPA: ATP-binding protein [Dissulfurispiraceae bacterium]
MKENPGAQDATTQIKHLEQLAEDERQRLEEELLKAQKLESLGILAGGLAHDFNNLLTAILGNISIVKTYIHLEDNALKRLDEAERAAVRARDLTRQLLTFSQGGVPLKKTLLLADFLQESVGFSLRGTNIRCECSILDSVWPVEADEGQINQVINNLVINATQAMPEGGTIEISCENCILGEHSALPLKEGRYVKVSVRDHGIGIPGDHLPKIFDPYFTTKQKGSGLGLAISYSIINKHHGHIAVESKLGAGTAFHVYLPAAPEGVRTKKAEDRLPPPGRGKVLVMDDEESVRDVAGAMLKSLGYSVAFACDGNEAAELYRREGESGNSFDVVIMDLTIPGGMGGKEAMEKLLEIDPRVKVIVSSGYSNDPLMAEYVKHGFSGVLAKPYKVKDMGIAVHRLIRGDVV